MKSRASPRAHAASSGRSNTATGCPSRRIDDELGKAKGLGGRPRKLDDQRNKVRNRVCNAIRRALKKIGQFDRPLAEHLTKPVLNLGHSINYIPRDGVAWSSCDAVSPSNIEMLHQE